MDSRLKKGSKWGPKVTLKKHMLLCFWSFDLRRSKSAPKPPSECFWGSFWLIFDWQMCWKSLSWRHMYPQSDKCRCLFVARAYRILGMSSSNNACYLHHICKACSCWRRTKLDSRQIIASRFFACLGPRTPKAVQIYSKASLRILLRFILNICLTQMFWTRGENLRWMA